MVSRVGHGVDGRRGCATVGLVDGHGIGAILSPLARVGLAVAWLVLGVGGVGGVVAIGTSVIVVARGMLVGVFANVAGRAMAAHAVEPVLEGFVVVDEETKLRVEDTTSISELHVAVAHGVRSGVAVQAAAYVIVKRMASLLPRREASPERGKLLFEGSFGDGEHGFPVVLGTEGPSMVCLAKDVSGCV